MESPIPIATRSTDGRTVRIEFDSRTLTTEQAHAFAFALGRAATLSENMPERHERHVNLRASCPLCVYEAHGQTDMLISEEEVR